VLVKCRNCLNAAVAGCGKVDLGDQKAHWEVRVKELQKQLLASRVGDTKAEFVAQELRALQTVLSAPTKPGPFVGDRTAAKHVLQVAANYFH
jgi:hypothetical protein